MSEYIKQSSVKLGGWQGREVPAGISVQAGYEHNNADGPSVSLDLGNGPLQVSICLTPHGAWALVDLIRIALHEFEE